MTCDDSFLTSALCLLPYLPVSAEDVIGECHQPVALGRGGKRGRQVLFGSMGIADSALEGVVHRTMTVEQVLDRAPGIWTDGAVGDHTLNQLGDFRTGFSQQQDDRQGDLAFPQISADGLSQR